jgi:hypothetical protein
LNDEIDWTVAVVPLGADDQAGNESCRNDSDDNVGGKAGGHETSENGGTSRRPSSRDSSTQAGRAGEARSSVVQSALESNGAGGLVRAIGLGSAILLVTGSVIGSGIFMTTGGMASSIPSATLLLAAWMLGGVLAIAGGLTYAEMGAMFPRSGGVYVFLREAFGPLPAFLYGWAALPPSPWGSPSGSVISCRRSRRRAP